MSCESWDSNAPYDIVPKPQPGDHLNPIHCYLGDHMEKYLTHPYASPLFGDFKGLPPMLIQAGDVEVLRDEITLLAHKASLAGVEVRHELYEDMVRLHELSVLSVFASNIILGSRIPVISIPRARIPGIYLMPRLRLEILASMSSPNTSGY